MFFTGCSLSVYCNLAGFIFIASTVTFDITLVCIHPSPPVFITIFAKVIFESHKTWSPCLACFLVGIIYSFLIAHKEIAGCAASKKCLVLMYPLELWPLSTILWTQYLVTCLFDTKTDTELHHTHSRSVKESEFCDPYDTPVIEDME